MCTHERTIERLENGYEDWDGMHISGHHVRETTSLCVDIDLHRYQCTSCKEIFYYYGRAKRAYETGDFSELI